MDDTKGDEGYYNVKRKYKTRYSLASYDEEQREELYKRKCDNCGKAFHPTVPRQRLCSDLCRFIVQREEHKTPATPTTKICVGCRIKFKTNKYNKVYCSSECYKATAGKLRSRHSGNGMREYFLEKYDFLCQECGERFGWSDLAVHHIVPIYKGGEDTEENLTVLCHKHHYEAHRAIEKKARSNSAVEPR